MADNEKTHQVLHRQALEIVCHVYQFFKWGVESETRACSSVAKCQVRTADACGVGIRMVQQISSEANASVKAYGSTIFKSPGKQHSRKKEVRELDDFSKNFEADHFRYLTTVDSLSSCLLYTSRCV